MAKIISQRHRRHQKKPFSPSVDHCTKNNRVTKARIESIAHEKEKLKAENIVLLPDANYTKEVVKSDETYTMTQIAKSLGILVKHSRRS